MNWPGRAWPEKVALRLVLQSEEVRSLLYFGSIWQLASSVVVTYLTLLMRRGAGRVLWLERGAGRVFFLAEQGRAGPRRDGTAWQYVRHKENFGRLLFVFDGMN